MQYYFVVFACIWIIVILVGGGTYLICYLPNRAHFEEQRRAAEAIDN